VLSKARRRWGKEVFQRLFVRTVEQCVAAGLVAGDKLHVDASLIAANASKDSVVKSSPELIAACAAAYEAAEKKLDDRAERPCYQAVNDVGISTTDPDAGLVRKGGQGSHPAYHHHRVVDDAQGVITAVETTSGSIAENKELMDVVSQHEQNTGCAARTAVADHKYGTAENFVACHEKGIVTHLGDAKAKAGQVAGIFPESAFVYDAQRNQFTCPARQPLRCRRFVKRQHVWEYGAAKGVCASCALPTQCTRSKTGRTITRHEHAESFGNLPLAIAPRRRQGRPATTAVFNRRQFCRCRQQPRVQTRALAPVMAAANPGLSDRGHSEHPDFTGANRAAARSQHCD